MLPETPARSKKLTRQLTRYLAEATPELLESLTGLLGSVDKSYEEYEDKIKFTIRSLEVSSSELNESNRSLEKLNLTINTILDSLGQGLLFFDKDGICSPVYSEACLSLLENSPGDKAVADILHLFGQQREDFEMWLAVVFEGTGALPFSDLKSLAPQSLTNSKDQYIELDYRPLYFNDEMTGILLIATDKSAERDAAKSIEKTRNEAKKIESVAKRRNEFWRFLYNLEAFLSHLDPQSEREEVMRGLHTYKGLSQVFGLSELAALLHQAESKADTAPLDQETIREIEGEMNHAATLGTDLFGPDFLQGGRVRTFEYAKLDQLKKLISENVPQDELMTFFNREILAVPICEGFDIFRSEIMRISETQGKPAPHIVCVNGEQVIILKDYEIFFDGLVHLARNIVDHGIENPSQRRNKGKSDAGNIEILCETFAQDGKPFYRITISDDGRGFDIAKLRLRLLEHNPASADFSDQQVIDCVFDPDLSTAAHVTALSGRGVGMNAVRSATEELGGTVIAQPSPKGGAQFIFTLPCRL